MFQRLRLMAYASEITQRVVTSLAILLAICGAAIAVPVTFRFDTSMDTSVVGGAPGTPLAVVYTFDSESANGTGGVIGGEGSGSYGPLTMQIRLGDQVVSAVGGGIYMWDNTGDHTDGYDVRPGSGPESFTGQLFGLSISFFRFLVVDTDQTMFNGTVLPLPLPLTPCFVAAADFQQTGFDLFNDELSVSVGVNEFPDIPPEQRTPFTLTLLPTGDFNYDGTVDGADYVVWRKSLGTVYTQDDYAVWRAHFGETAGGTTLPTADSPPVVPKPTTFCLATVALGAWNVLRRRRRPNDDRNTRRTTYGRKQLRIAFTGRFHDHSYRGDII